MRRIMIAGSGSGCGKTTITCALLQALKDRGMDAVSFKCGPDYIDPMFHKAVIGAPSYNLDSYLMSGGTIKYLLKRNSGDFSVIEGVMGFYDGAAFSEKASSHELSRITDTPVVLVVNGRGMSLSAAAVVKGFVEFRDNNIVGVIFNNVTSSVYENMAAECEKIGVKPLGFMPYIKEANLESRHLGLVTAQEVAGLREKIHIMAEYAKKYIDLDAILKLAECGDIVSGDIASCKIANVKLALARDKAFCFYYEDNLRLLCELGAEITEFSPLANERVPECDGLILGGGYPELYADALERNTVSTVSVRECIENGMPCIAECGGFMYLHKFLESGQKRYKMAGVIDGTCRKTDKLQRFGYMEMRANRDNILCKSGEKIRSREFHYFDSDSCGDGFTAQKQEREWQCVHVENKLFAGFAHLHFYSDTRLAENFIKSCEEYKCTK